MHREFRELLDGAIGVSEFVFVLNIDVRGFSDWSLTVDSAQTALFVKRIYAKLIDRYFGSASFVKPTGDGLLVVVTFSEDQLAATATKIIRDSIELVEGFGDLCLDEDMINFPVPREVGVGVARGAASRLASGEKTLDYTGRVLNLASRLMELARPRGVVFDAGLGPELLPDDLSRKFQRQNVYLKGVSPDTSTSIYYWPSDIEIGPAYLHPHGEKKWEQITDTVTMADLGRLGGNELSYDLIPPPGPVPELFCMVSHDAVTSGGRKSKKFSINNELPVALLHKGATHRAQLTRSLLLKYLQNEKVGPTWDVRLELSYRSR